MQIFWLQDIKSVQHVCGNMLPADLVSDYCTSQ